MANERKGGRASRGDGGNGGGGGQETDAEFRRGKAPRVALIPGRTFRAKPVLYSEVDGLAMVEGDIVLGTVEQVDAMTEALRQEASGTVAAGVVISGANRHWPSCRVPFTIDPTLPDQGRVTGAIAHWESRTSYRFIARTTEVDFVTFRPAGGCSSSVGRQSGQQFVNLGPSCTQGNCIHEIGHVIGLWHEQSREDRDLFVTIHLDKVTAGMEHNFDQHITDGDDVGGYDYGSIMHYPRDAFSVDGSDTITPVDPTASIGQRVALSAGDVAAANSLCSAVTVKEPARDTFKEPPRDTRIETIKELTKDIRLDTRKEMIRDTVKEMIRDPIKRAGLDLGPGTFVELPVTPGQPVLRPGGILPQLGGGRPFAIATKPQPSRAMEGGGTTGDETSDESIAAMDADLQALADRIVQVEAEKAALQAQYDETAVLLQQAVDAREASEGR